jgi:thymidylate kinase
MCSQAGLWSELFRLLEEREIRYCVLHSYQDLPESVAGDLDLAVDPRFASELERALGELPPRGYAPFQSLRYAVGGTYRVIGWWEGTDLKLAALDVIHEHRRSGLILATAEEMLEGRRRLRTMWVADPGVEFRYLLAKKTLKRSLPERAAERLRELAGELGAERAAALAGELFGREAGARVAAACAAGSLEWLLPKLRSALYLRRNPAGTLRWLAGEALRLWRRWWAPTGLLVAVLGPDGAGKTSLIDTLAAQLEPAFRRLYRFHWRPGLIWPPAPPAGTAPPGRRVAHGPWFSALCLAACLVDYWLGYALRIRPWLARTGLVIFDRYFDDVLADPRRYGYGGPAWLARVLLRWRPQPDLILVLDAPEQVLLSRKPESEPAQLQAARSVYLELGRVIDAARPLEQVAVEASGAVVERLHARLTAPPPAPAASVWRALYRFLGEGCERWYGVLSSGGGPRWLLPLESRRATLEGLRIYTPYARFARFAKAALCACVRLGWRGWARRRLALAAGARSPLTRLVRDLTGEPQPEFALSLTRGRYAKLTVQVSSPERGVLGYVKLPLEAGAAGRIRHEAEMLAGLQQFAEVRPHLPQVIYAGRWEGTYVLFEQAGGGDPGPAAWTPLHERFLASLAGASRREKAGSDLVGEVDRQWRQAPALDAAWQGLAAEALDRAYSQLAGARVACGASHGDFAPWNTRVSRGMLYVFDWESAAWEQPLAWDRYHFQVQVGGINGGWRPRSDAAGFSLLLLYLVHSAARLAEEGSCDQDRDLRYRRRLLTRLLS